MENNKRVSGLLRIIGLSILSGVIMAGCSTEEEPVKEEKKRDTSLLTFERVLPEHSGVDFENNIIENKDHTMINFDYMYNGGGVAVGDINNDGLDDLYFTGNMVPDKLYLNRGDFKFDDITELANLDGIERWGSGAQMVDINNDGFLDIYVCRSYYGVDTLRANQLYINNGDLTFSDQAKAYGLADIGHSVQASFFDYDKDGDLDLYVMNHPTDFGDLNEAKIKKFLNPGPLEHDRFYKNNGNGTFSDVTEQAGIKFYGYGLSITVSDMNNDTWPDVYIANDYEQPDMMFINNKDGSFTESSHEMLKHTSMFAMGADIADFNNDALVDIVVLDMMARDNFRQKTNMRSMNPPRFWKQVNLGYHYQYMRNSLQLNNGNGTFSEIGILSGIAYTDWSWAALFADFDNDGLKDLFAANGFRRDTRNIDFRLFLDANYPKDIGDWTDEQKLEIVEKMPEQKLLNYYFHNKGDLKFEEITKESGITIPTFTYGAAYVDLDNDGDLELIFCNLTDEVFIYKNNSREANGNHYLRINLKGDEKDVQGLGAKVTIKTAEGLQFQEMEPVRGYQSSVEPTLHFGLGQVDKVNSVEVLWLDGTVSIMENVDVDQELTIDKANAKPAKPKQKKVDPLFADVSKKVKATFAHQENEYDDYEAEILLPHNTSMYGPSLAVGDANGDGKEDFYVGGAVGQAGALYIQSGTGFKAASGPWTSDKAQEDVGAAFFDADGDGDQDLYVSSGGNEFTKENDPMLADRLYLNNGKGSFTKSNAHPGLTASAGRVVPGDYDNDGDEDLFVAGRLVPGKYPLPAASHILRNDNGQLTDVTEEVAPALLDMGLVASALWTDHNGDGQMDLMLGGEWMHLTMLEQQNGVFTDKSKEYGLENTTGWWFSMAQGDFDGDGDMDYVAGNLGLNYKYKATHEEPFHVYLHDFDESGTLDIVLGYYNEGVCFPVRGRQCSSQQMPVIAKKFPSYADFGQSTLEDIYGGDLESALHYAATTFESVYIENKGNGQFQLKKLPTMAQLSPHFSTIADDFDGDGNLDVLMAGNLYMAEVETGRADAGIGTFLKGDGKGGFAHVPAIECGFLANEDVRDMALITVNGQKVVLVANNNGPMQAIAVKQ